MFRRARLSLLLTALALGCVPSSSPGPGPRSPSTASPAKAPNVTVKEATDGETGSASPGRPQELSAPAQAVVAARQALLAGDLEAVRQVARDLLKEDPKDPDAQLLLLQVELTELAVPMSLAEAPGDSRLSLMVRHLDEILKSNPSHAATHMEKGRILLTLGRTEEALASLQEAMRLGIQDPEAFSALGVALIATGHAQDAVQWLERAADSPPPRAARFSNLGTVYMLVGRVTDAIATYRQALELDPEDAKSHNDLGSALLADSQPQVATEHLERAVQLAPDRATFRTNLGHAYQRQGRFQEARAAHEEALSLDPRLSAAWLNLGTLRATQGNFSEAQRLFEKAARLDPSDPRPARLLKDLRELRSRPQPPTAAP